MQKKNPPLESAVVREIMQTLRSEGYAVWKINGNGYQQRGLPDLVTIDRKGRFVGLEVKRPKPSGYGATTLQLATLRKINSAGGYACIVRSALDAMRAITNSEALATIGPDADLEECNNG